MSFEINIISTGSHGNAVVIDNCILIDVGLNYSRLRDTLLSVDKILITHRHGDHLQLPALRKLHQERPWKLASSLHCNLDVAIAIESAPSKRTPLKVERENIFDVTDSFEIQAGGQTYKVDTFPLDHDVTNQGFVFTKEDGQKLIFATDTSTMKHAPKGPYEYIVIEGNYDEDKIIESLMSDDFNESYRASRNLRHLSIQSFEKFVTANSIPGITRVWQLHESGVFGMRSGLAEIIEERV